MKEQTPIEKSIVQQNVRSKRQLAKAAGQPVGQGSSQVPPGLACYLMAEGAGGGRREAGWRGAGGQMPRAGRTHPPGAAG